jgi:hypothetical protein
MLDQNARLEKEYQQMMLASCVSTSSKDQIANEFKFIGEYGHSNPLWEFQPTSWPEVDPFFPYEYPRCPDGNQTKLGPGHTNLDWQYNTKRFTHQNEANCQLL